MRTTIFKSVCIPMRLKVHNFQLNLITACIQPVNIIYKSVASHRISAKFVLTFLRSSHDVTLSFRNINRSGRSNTLVQHSVCAYTSPVKGCFVTGCDLRVYKFCQCVGVWQRPKVWLYSMCVYVCGWCEYVCVGIVCACINFIVYVD